jgi:hypothetical protein
MLHNILASAVCSAVITKVHILLILVMLIISLQQLLLLGVKMLL